MHTAWTPPWRWVFGVATVLGAFSTLQAYRLSVVSTRPGYPIEIGSLLALNFMLWYVPALYMPVVVHTSRRYPLHAGRRIRALAVHASAALLLAAFHTATMIALRLLLAGGSAKPMEVAWSTHVQRRFLLELDWCLVTYAVMAGICHAFAYHHESQERKLREAHLQTSLVEARLKTLEWELHPHFLFNTLHAISTLLHRDPDAADRVISRLSDLLRLTLAHGGDATITLREEVDFLEKYLGIEAIRFADRLAVDVAIDPDALDAAVPRLVLQPLVENAIKHGIASRADGGTVQIAGGRTGDRLWMEVRDNGEGPRRPEGGDVRAGVGLSNTRARLDCLYGTDYRLELLEQHGGTTARLDIPFRRAPAAGSESFRVA
jgi:signal transduction histidine kinase